MTCALSYVNQFPPQRFTRRKHLAHDHAEPAITREATRNLRRQRQELLRYQPLLEEIGQSIPKTHDLLVFTFVLRSAKSQ